MNSFYNQNNQKNPNAMDIDYDCMKEYEQRLKNVPHSINQDYPLPPIPPIPPNTSTTTIRNGFKTTNPFK